MHTDSTLLELIRRSKYDEPIRRDAFLPTFSQAGVKRVSVCLCVCVWVVECVCVPYECCVCVHCVCCVLCVWGGGCTYVCVCN